MWTAVMLEWGLSLSPHLALTRLGVTLLGPLRLTIILLLAHSLTQCTMLNRGVAFLTVIGHYGLFAFLLHRVILHAMAFMNTHALPLVRGELAYLGYMLGTISLTTLLCWLRKHCAPYDQALRKLYL
jgi:hypothetical protein